MTRPASVAELAIHVQPGVTVEPCHWCETGCEDCGGSGKLLVPDCGGDWCEWSKGEGAVVHDDDCERKQLAANTQAAADDVGD